MIGTTLVHYRITAKLGEGGMGAVYRATDTHLGRDVALKFLPPELAAQPERASRFEREARLLAALNHPNIAVIHGFEHADDKRFLIMELVDGEDLARRLDRVGKLDPDEVVRIGEQIARALAHAHRKSIVHRDLKPANVVLTSSGRAKVLDFGLARLLESEEEADPEGFTRTAPADITRAGAMVGTPAYMSPEQAMGQSLDSRTDLFSLGALLYEMLSGRRPFAGETSLEIASNILKEEPAPLEGVPGGLASLVERCLAKDPDARPESAEAIAEELHALRSDVVPTSVRLRARLWVPALALAAIAIAAGTWFWRQSTRERWVRTEAIPQIESLAQRLQFVEALHLARHAATILPDDPQIQLLLGQISYPTTIVTDPPGARVAVKQYSNVDGEWEILGTTPITDLRVADGFLRLRIEKEGYETLEGSFMAGRDDEPLHLLEAGSAPEGMVRVKEGRVLVGAGGAKRVPEFWIDRTEVTNRHYRGFVTSGGYTEPGYWEHPFRLGSRELSWKEAMERFRDRTGRPGPATWELGTFPEGADDLPVEGISWYEAEAFARFVGKSLPTVYHWHRAAAMRAYSDILPHSNIGGASEGLAPVASFPGLGPYGTYDMAGNVREWCHNRTEERRFILGGRWSDPAYRYRDLDAIDPFDRSAGNGLRLIQSTTDDSDLRQPVDDPVYDFNEVEPVDDDTFEVFRRMYAYDRQPVQATVEAVEDDHPQWRQETVSFQATYGDSRVPVHIFLPKNAQPPYQPVLFFPHAAARELTSSRDLRISLIADWIPRTGRALIYPVYEGTYERGGGQPSPVGYARRDQIVHWAKDVQRTIDYLETRSDIDTDKLAFYGISLGAEYGPIFTAIDSRFRASVLLGPHLHAHQMVDAPEIQPVHFGPRSKVPVLMINGRDDFGAPLETALEPMLRFQGAPERDKELKLLEGGHIPASWHDAVAEALEWLDRYLGSVELTGEAL